MGVFRLGATLCDTTSREVARHNLSGQDKIGLSQTQQEIDGHDMLRLGKVHLSNKQFFLREAGTGVT